MVVDSGSILDFQLTAESADTVLPFIVGRQVLFGCECYGANGSDRKIFAGSQY
jgi:hypothetical protein